LIQATALRWPPNVCYHARGRRTVDSKLELVAVLVSDVDRAKTFYTEQAGFIADHDHRASDEIRSFN
jgi:hypothetical protein